MQLMKNRTSGICKKRPRWNSLKGLHEVSYIPAVRNIQLRIANNYLKCAKGHKIEPILELTQKKDNDRRTVGIAH